jgi:hypothetical protein
MYGRAGEVLMCTNHLSMCWKMSVNMYMVAQ